jgi:lysozyme
MSVQGIDVSNHQGRVDWAAVALTKGFAFIKASEGVRFVDPYFRENWAGSRDAGIVRGAYHYALPSANLPRAEAAHFLTVLDQQEGGLLPGDLLALDLEDPDVAPHRDLLEWTLGWLERVEEATGVRPVLYSRLNYLAAHGLLDIRLTGYPLWLAHYQSTPPAVPYPLRRFLFWQYSATGMVGGVDAHCDLDEFFGALDELRALGKPGGLPDPAQDWQTVIDVTRGWGRELAVMPDGLTVTAMLARLKQGAKELGDVAGILEGLRSQQQQ